MSIDGLAKELQPFSIIMLAGLPGSGKSFVGRAVAELLSGNYFSSDEYREKMFASSRFDLAGDEIVRKLSMDAYLSMYRDAAKVVKKGGRAVIDATHLKPERQEMIRLLPEFKAKTAFLVVKCEEMIAAQWMRLKEGMANEQETHFEAWQRVRGYFKKHLAVGEYSWPSEAVDGVRVVEYWNH
jgi:predicted kinase